MQKYHCVLCTIINTGSDDAVLPNYQHTGEMKPLSDIDDSLNPPAVNEVTHEIKFDHIDAQVLQAYSHSSPWCKIPSKLQPMPKNSVLMPSNAQIHRQVLLNDAKSDSGIGQTDLIKMHIATRLDEAPVAAQPYSLALKHHKFLKKEIKNLLDAGIMCKSMSPWAIPIVVVKKTHIWRFSRASLLVYRL